MNTVTEFTQSVYVPMAIAFFGMAANYVVLGGQALFQRPKKCPEVDKTIGAWGFWMGGFMPFVTGVYLMVGLSWFAVYTAKPPLYLFAVTLTAYGVQWFVGGWRRYVGAGDGLEGWMSAPFVLLSLLGTLILFRIGAVMPAILFLLLTLVYAAEISSRRVWWPRGDRVTGVCRIMASIWLLYLTFAMIAHIVIGGGL